MKKLVSAGEILVEIMATDDRRGFLEPVPLIGPFPSGAPAIFIDQVAKLGQPGGMIGCVGDDDFGRVNLERLRAGRRRRLGDRGSPGRATGSAFVALPGRRLRDFVFNIRHSAGGAIAATSARRGADRPTPTISMSWARRCPRPPCEAGACRRPSG